MIDMVACPLGKLDPEISINEFAGRGRAIISFMVCSPKNPPIMLNNNNSELCHFFVISKNVNKPMERMIMFMLPPKFVMKIIMLLRRGVQRVAICAFNHVSIFGIVVF